MMPTLCELTGAAYPKLFKGKNILPVEGQSLAPEIVHGQTQRHKPLFWSLNGHKAVLAGNFKLEAVSKDAPWELYDITRDRSEMNDLAKTFPAKVKEMSAMWEQWANKVGVYEQQPKDQNE